MNKNHLYYGTKPTTMRNSSNNLVVECMALFWKLKNKKKSLIVLLLEVYNQIHMRELNCNLILERTCPKYNSFGKHYLT